MKSGADTLNKNTSFSVVSPSQRYTYFPMGGEGGSEVEPIASTGVASRPGERKVCSFGGELRWVEETVNTSFRDASDGFIPV